MTNENKLEKIEEKVLVVEDNFSNAMSALIGLNNYKDIKNIEVVGVYDLAKEKLDTYQPTVALVDMNFKRTENSKPEYLGIEFGKELKKREIPYLYVTGISEKYSHGHEIHEIIIGIEVKKENDEGDLETLVKFDKFEKDEEVWQKAYDKLNEVYRRK